MHPFRFENRLIVLEANHTHTVPISAGETHHSQEGLEHLKLGPLRSAVFAARYVRKWATLTYAHPPEARAALPFVHTQPEDTTGRCRNALSAAQRRGKSADSHADRVQQVAEHFAASGRALRALAVAAEEAERAGGLPPAARVALVGRAFPLAPPFSTPCALPSTAHTPAAQAAAEAAPAASAAPSNPPARPPTHPQRHDVDEGPFRLLPHGPVRGRPPQPRGRGGRQPGNRPSPETAPGSDLARPGAWAHRPLRRKMPPGGHAGGPLARADDHPLTPPAWRAVAQSFLPDMVTYSSPEAFLRAFRRPAAPAAPPGRLAQSALAAVATANNHSLDLGEPGRAPLPAPPPRAPCQRATNVFPPPTEPHAARARAMPRAAAQSPRPSLLQSPRRARETDRALAAEGVPSSGVRCAPPGQARAPWCSFVRGGVKARRGPPDFPPQSSAAAAAGPEAQPLTRCAPVRVRGPRGVRGAQVGLYACCYGVNLADRVRPAVRASPRTHPNGHPLEPREVVALPTRRPPIARPSRTNRAPAAGAGGGRGHGADPPRAGRGRRPREVLYRLHRLQARVGPGRRRRSRREAASAQRS